MKISRAITSSGRSAAEIVLEGCGEGVAEGIVDLDGSGEPGEPGAAVPVADGVGAGVGTGVAFEVCFDIRQESFLPDLVHLKVSPSLFFTFPTFAQGAPFKIVFADSD